MDRLLELNGQVHKGLIWKETKLRWTRWKSHSKHLWCVTVRICWCKMIRGVLRATIGSPRSSERDDVRGIAVAWHMVWMQYLSRRVVAWHCDMGICARSHHCRSRVLCSCSVDIIVQWLCCAQVDKHGISWPKTHSLFSLSTPHTSLLRHWEVQS